MPSGKRSSLLKPHELPSTRCKIEADEIYTTSIHISTGAYDALPPSLTDSESESDPESESESDQEYELPSTACEVEAAKIYSSNMHIKSAGAYDSLASSLTDSESESDPESESKSDQEYAMEEISIKHQHDSPPNVTDIASAGGIGSEKVNLEDDVDLTIVARDKNKNAENSDTRKCVAIQ